MKNTEKLDGAWRRKISLIIEAVVTNSVPFALAQENRKEMAIISWFYQNLKRVVHTKGVEIINCT